MSSGPDGGGRITRATITEQLEEALRVDILTGILRPGTRIRAVEMADRYGVSATPLREALQRLAGDNLIDLDPRLGASVAAMSERELRDIYEMLTWLGGLALERSIEFADEGWDARVRAAFNRLTQAVERQERIGSAPTDAERRGAALAWSSAHWAFHEALYSACSSPWLRRFLRQLHAHADRYQMPTTHGLSAHRRDSRGEHAEIMKAALDGDARTAVDALRRHFGLTVDILLDERSIDGHAVAKSDRAKNAGSAVDNGA